MGMPTFCWKTRPPDIANSWKFICWFWYIFLTFVPKWFNRGWCTLVYQHDHQTVVSDGTVNRWWSCHWYYCVLYLASSILHISMLCLTLIVCCMYCSLCWCSFCNTHSDNRQWIPAWSSRTSLPQTKQGYSRLTCVSLVLGDNVKGHHLYSRMWN
jgi:hypothetical protein